MDLHQMSYIGILVQSIKTGSQKNPFVIATVGNDVHRLNQNTSEKFPIAYSDIINYRVLNDESIDIDSGKILIWNSLNFFSEKVLENEFEVVTKIKSKNSEVTLKISIFLSSKDIKKIFDIKKAASLVKGKNLEVAYENNVSINTTHIQENDIQVDEKLNKGENTSGEVENTHNSFCDNLLACLKKYCCCCCKRKNDSKQL
ncbi:hypothetical protein SteCoe_9059 [Stentor coeruleus]|uniref:Uncharacterized protein n=1 Tax=Stentor coeruleus TaxID=5963 RepID=A0A1R2CIS8_9CILI|nr:hypothetical protein SteCoe_9059 [Stentor coeruleus]